MRALREAKPEFQTDGFGLKGPPRDPERHSAERLGDAVKSGVRREPRQPFFPEVEADTAAAAAGGGGGITNVSFAFRDATTSAGNPPVKTYKIKVLDGKIDGVFPTGMGFGNYILTIPSPADTLIYAGATFDPTTLEISSRFLQLTDYGTPLEARVESTSLGYFYWLLGFTYLDANGKFKFWNQRLGDIYKTVLYASSNGAPTLWAGEEMGHLDLDFL